MFEKHVSAILERVLGTYFEGFDPASLDVSVLQGKIALDDLRLRPSIAHAMGLPLRVTHGRVRRVELDISLQTLRGSPARMLIEGVDVEIAEASDAHECASAAGLAASARDARRSQLAKDRERRRQCLLAPQEQDYSSMTARMVTAFVNNLSIDVKNVGIRLATAGAVFALHVDSFSLSTTDSMWHASTSALPSDAEELFKQVSITNFGISAKFGPDPNTSRIVEPVNLRCRARMLLAVPTSFDKPLMAVDIQTSSLVCRISDRVIKEMAAAVERVMSAKQRRQRMASSLITLPATYRGHYGTWWRYAIEQVRRDLGACRVAMGLEAACLNASRAREYAPLFKRWLRLLPLPPLLPHEETAMYALEDSMPDHMVMALRTGVQQRVQVEAREVLARAAQDQRGLGLLSRLFGNKQADQGLTAGAANVYEDSIVVGGYQVDLSKEERKTLESILESRAVAVTDVDDCGQHAAPGTWNKYELSATVDAAEIALMDKEETELITAEIAQLSAAAHIRCQSSVFNAEVVSIRVNGFSGEGVAETVLGLDPACYESTVAPLLRFEYALHSPDHCFQHNLWLRLAPTLLVLDMALTLKLQAWWKNVVQLPQVQSDVLQRARRLAADALHQAQERTHASLVHTLFGEQACQTKVDLELSAPTVLMKFACGAHDAMDAQSGSECKRMTVAAMRLGVFRLSNGHHRDDVSVADGDAYSLFLTDMRFALGKGAKGPQTLWSSQAAWRQGAGLVDPFTVALDIGVRKTKDARLISGSSVQVAGRVTALKLILSHIDLEQLQMMVSHLVSLVPTYTLHLDGFAREPGEHPEAGEGGGDNSTEGTRNSSMHRDKCSNPRQNKPAGVHTAHASTRSMAHPFRLVKAASMPQGNSDCLYSISDHKGSTVSEQCVAFDKTSLADAATHAPVLRRGVSWTEGWVATKKQARMSLNPYLLPNSEEPQRKLHNESTFPHILQSCQAVVEVWGINIQVDSICVGFARAVPGFSTTELELPRTKPQTKRDCLLSWCRSVALFISLDSAGGVNSSASVQDFGVDLAEISDEDGDALNEKTAGHGLTHVVSSDRTSRFEREMHKTEELYRAAFRKHSSERSDIDAADLVHALRCLGANVTQRIAESVLAKLDSNSSGTLDEEQFLQLVKLVTRKMETNIDSGQNAAASQSEPTDELESYHAFRLVYSQDPGNRAELKVQLRRVEINLTVEPLELLLETLDCLKLRKTDMLDKDPAKASDDDSLENNKVSLTWIAKLDSVCSAWIQRIRRGAFSRKSMPDSILMDVSVSAGPLECAFAPYRDSVNGENALVFSLQSLTYSSRADEQLLPQKLETALPRVRFNAQGLTVILAEFPLGPPDGDRQLLKPCTLDYLLSYSRSDGTVVASTRVCIDKGDIEITAAQLIWILGVLDKFSVVVGHSYDKTQRAHSANHAPIPNRVAFQEASAQVDSIEAADIESNASSFSCNGLQFTLKDFEEIPLLHACVDTFEITTRRLKDSLSLDGALALVCNAMSHSKQKWEPVIEPFKLTFESTSHREPVFRTDLQVASETFFDLDIPHLEINIASDHIYNLARAVNQIETALRDVVNQECVSRSVVHRQDSSHRANLSTFLETFMPVERVLFMNSTSLNLHIEIETAADMDNWQAPVASRSSVMVPRDLLKAFGVRLLALRDGNAPSYEKSPILFVIPGTSEATPPDGTKRALSRGKGATPVPSLIQTAVCKAKSQDPDAPQLRLQLRSTASKVLVHCPWVVENLCPQSILVTTYTSHQADAPASPAVVIPPGASEEQYTVHLSSDTPFFLAVSAEGYTSLTRARIMQQEDRCNKMVSVQDKEGRRLDLRLRIFKDKNNDTVVSVYPQMVIVNRCGLPLCVGRGTQPSDVEQISGQDGWQRSEENTLPWNHNEPEVLMFSLPEGHEWSPWMRLSGSAPWTRISQTEFDDPGLRGGEAWRKTGDEFHVTERDHDGLGREALNLVSRLQLAAEGAGKEGVPMSVELGIEMRVGSCAFHASVYMEVMPALTFVNSSEHTLEVEAVGGNSLTLAPGEQRASLGAFQLQDGARGKQKYRLLMKHGRHDVQSGAFFVDSERLLPLSLWPDSALEDDVCEGMVIVEMRVKRRSATTFVWFGTSQEHLPLCQIRNLSSAHKVHLYQPPGALTNMQPTSAGCQGDIEGVTPVRLISVAPGQTRAVGWNDPEAAQMLQVCVSASSKDFHGGHAEFLQQPFRALVMMNRIGQKGVVAALAAVPQEALERVGGGDPGTSYSVTGRRNKDQAYVSYVTLLLGRSRVLEIHDHNPDEEGRILASRTSVLRSGRVSSVLNKGRESVLSLGATVGRQMVGPAAAKVVGAVRRWAERDGDMTLDLHATDEDDPGAVEPVLVHVMVNIGRSQQDSVYRGLGLSLVDETRCELLHAVWSDVSLSLCQTAPSLYVRAKINSCQMDNQCPHGPRVAVMSPFKVGDEEDPNACFLQARLELSRTVTSTSYWRDVQVFIDPVRVQLDEQTLWNLLQFEDACSAPPCSSQQAGAGSQPLVRSDSWSSLASATGCAGSGEQIARGTRHEPGSVDPLTGLAPRDAQMWRTLEDIVENLEAQHLPVHFERMKLSSVTVQTTLLGLRAVRWRPRQDEASAQRLFGDLYSQLRPLAETTGLPDVERHKMVLPAMSIADESIGRESSLASVLWSHYRNQVMFQGLKVLGSSAFWTSLLGGAGDTQQTQETKLKEAAIKRAREGEIGSVRQGFVSGLGATGTGLWEGVTGVITKPIEGAANAGVGGAFSGLWGGALGLITKPATGVVRLVTQTASGLSAELQGVGARVPRVREPRPIYWDGVLRQYCAVDARAFKSLSTATRRGEINSVLLCEGFVGALQVSRGHFNALLPGQFHDLKYHYLLFSRQKVRLLGSVDESSADDALLATIETELDVNSVATVRLEQRGHEGAVTLLGFSGDVLLTVDLAHGDRHADMHADKEQEPMGRFNALCLNLKRAMPFVSVEGLACTNFHRENVGLYWNAATRHRLGV